MDLLMHKMFLLTFYFILYIIKKFFLTFIQFLKDRAWVEEGQRERET